MKQIWRLLLILCIAFLFIGCNPTFLPGWKARSWENLKPMLLNWKLDEYPSFAAMSVSDYNKLKEDMANDGYGDVITKKTDSKITIYWDGLEIEQEDNGNNTGDWKIYTGDHILFQKEDYDSSKFPLDKLPDISAWKYIGQDYKQNYRYIYMTFCYRTNSESDAVDQILDIGSKLDNDLWIGDYSSFTWRKLFSTGERQVNFQFKDKYIFLEMQIERNR